MDLASDIARIGTEVVDDAEFAIKGLLHLRQHFNDHPFWEPIVQHLDDLIADGQKLKAQRASLTADLASTKADRDAEKARADAAEASLADLQKQVADDEAKALAAKDDLDAELTAEGADDAPEVPASTTVQVAAATTAPTVTIPVGAADAASTVVGSTISGVGIPDGATVIGVTDTHPQTGGPAITIDDATTADHAAGDTVTVTPPVAGDPALVTAQPAGF